MCRVDNYQRLLYHKLAMRTNLKKLDWIAFRGALSALSPYINVLKLKTKLIKLRPILVSDNTEHIQNSLQLHIFKNSRQNATEIVH